MSIVEQKTTKINEKLSELISRTQELKIELDVFSRSVRQWRKEIKLSYALVRKVELRTRRERKDNKSVARRATKD